LLRKDLSHIRFPLSGSSGRRFESFHLDWAKIKTVEGSQAVVKLSGTFPLSTMDFKVNTMTTATDTDLQQVKDLIITGNAATQKQIADLAAITQKQIADLAATNQKQIADLAFSTQQQFSETQKQIAKLEQRVEVGFAKLEGDIKTLDTKFDEKTKSLDQRITSKEFTIRGVTVAILGGLLLAFGKLLFFGKI
jgi:hypothetical protein